MGTILCPNLSSGITSLPRLEGVIMREITNADLAKQNKLGRAVLYGTMNALAFSAFFGVSAVAVMFVWPDFTNTQRVIAIVAVAGCGVMALLFTPTREYKELRKLEQSMFGTDDEK